MGPFVVNTRILYSAVISRVLRGALQEMRGFAPDLFLQVTVKTRTLQA
jgi:hypothetical protein